MIIELADADGTDVARQVGHSIGDVNAKPVFGLVIRAIARAKSEDDGYSIEGKPT